MSKQQRHELKKIEKARRRQSLFRVPRSDFRVGAAALSAAAAIAAGTQAYAAPIRFDNPPGPGHYDWFSGSPTQIPLDVTLPAASQGEISLTAGEFRQFLNGGGNNPAVTSGGPSIPGALQADSSGYFLVGVNAGTLIPSGTPWGSYLFSHYTGYGTQLPPGVPTYLGVRFDRGLGYQFGWIGVVMDGNTFGLDAFAWGYETTPGVPVAAGAPEPGTLALLAFGALAVWRRRP